MKKILTKFWPFIVIVLLSGLIVWPLFLGGYFSHHDDLQVMRIFEMRKCLIDLQIPCRWVPDMGYGNGYPLFNYYNPLPYYIGAIFSFLVGFITSAKILFFIPLFLGGISMYFLARELFNKQAALLSAVLFMFAPYRALDSYVRGAVAESFAIAVFPLVLYFAYRKKFILFAISLACFLTSHSIMTILFLPVLILMIYYRLWVENFKDFKKIVITILLGIGLSAFFTLPAYFEKDLVQIDNLTRLDLDFRAHFATFPQLFLDRSWGYGASFSGPDDTISFQIGLPHWALAFLSIPLVLIVKRKDKKLLTLYLGALFLCILSIFMTHNKSAFIWEKIGLLRFTQFPWRFLAVTIFTSSLLAGFLVDSLNKNLGRVLSGLLIILTAYLNWNYFKPDKFFPDMTDDKKLSGVEWETQQKAAILDYLPVGAQEPLENAPEKPLIEEGEADIKSFEKKSNSWTLSIDVKSPARVEMPITDFPNWKVTENGKMLGYSNDNYVKRISLNLEVGQHQILGKLTDTPIRNLANLMTLLSVALIIYLSYAKNPKIKL